MYKSRYTDTMRNQKPAQLAIVGTYEITLGNKIVSYTLKRSQKARLIWLNIKRLTGLIVTVPRNYDQRYLHEYLKSNSKWILHNLEKYCSEIPEPLSVVRPKNTISYLGKNITITQKRKKSPHTAPTLKQNTLIVSPHPSDEKLSAAELKDWLKSQAARVIKSKVSQFSVQMGLQYNRVVIRDQKSRWGSLLLPEKPEFQLETHYGSGAGTGLRDYARTLPFGGDEPLKGFLELFIPVLSEVA